MKPIDDWEWPAARNTTGYDPDPEASMRLVSFKEPSGLFMTPWPCLVTGLVAVLWYALCAWWSSR